MMTNRDNEGSQGSDETSNSCSIDNEGIQAHPIPIVMVSAATAMETTHAQLSVPLSTTNTTMPMLDDLYSSTMSSSTSYLLLLHSKEAAAFTSHPSQVIHQASSKLPLLR
jgi:hypothetical protein